MARPRQHDPALAADDERRTRTNRSGIGKSIRRAKASDFKPDEDLRNTQEVTYDELVEIFGSRPSGSRGVAIPSREEFNRLSTSEEVGQWRRDAFDHNETYIPKWERYQNIQAKYNTGEQHRQSEEEWQKRVDRFQSDLAALGQGSPDTQADFQNIAEMAMGLLSVEGDSEEAVAARQTAAVLFHDYTDQLAPHITAADPEWWANNRHIINGELQAMEPGAFKRGLEIVMGSEPAGYVFDVLGQTEQGAAHALMGLRAAIDGEDGVSAEEGLKHAGSSFVQGIAGFGQRLVTPGTDAGDDRYGIQNDRLIEGSGVLYSGDQDESGGLNLREALGKDAHGGGRALGLVDTIGLAAIDPLSWVSLGQAGQTRAAVNTLRASGDDVAVRAGTRIANGAKIADLDDVSRSAVESAFLRSAADNISRMSDSAVIRQTYGRPRATVRQLMKEADDVDKLREALIRTRANQMDAAVRRGSVPGLRVGGTTVLPMRRLYDALGIIDLRLADESGWAQRLLQTADLESTDELLAFIQTYDGAAMPPELRDQIQGWSAVANRMGESPEVWLDDLLQRAEDPATAFDEIEAFGRALLDDRTVDEWRPWFEQSFEVRQIVPTPNEARMAEAARSMANSAPMSEFSENLIRQADELGPRRAIEALNLSDLPEESLRKIDRNREVFENPHRWVQVDFEPRGLRSLMNRDNILGRLVRRTEAFRPRSRIRGNQRLGANVADQVDDAMSVAAAKRDLFEDHLTQLGLDRKGQSDVAVQAAKEVDGDVWEAAVRVLSDEDPKGAIAALDEAAQPAFTQLVRTLDSIRDDIFRLSVASGADEATLLARQGYMPRVYTREAQEAAERALRGSDSKLTDAFTEMGLIEDGTVTGQRSNPLAQGGHLRGRTYREELEDIFELNEAARQDLADSGLDGLDGFRLYEDNPLRAMLLRSRQAHEAHVYSSMVDNLTGITATNGRPLAYVAKTADDKARVAFNMAADEGDLGRLSYVREELPNGGEIFVERTVHREMQEARRIMGSPNFNGTWRGFMESWNNTWGAWATSPLIGFGFHVRNATGNFFNMILAGANNPNVVPRAAGVQREMRQVRRLMSDEGLSFPEASARLVDEGVIEESSVEVLRDVRKYNLMNSGQTADIFNEVDPLNPSSSISLSNNSMVDQGRRFGNAIENNARISLYIDGLDKGMAPAEAAARVRAHLFDYQDLTKFEADNIRMLSRFYTFMRKNTALQARMIATQPGRVVNAQRASDQFVDLIMGSEGQDVEEGNQGDGRFVPEWAANSMRLYGNDLVGVDTPLNSLMETVGAANSFLKIPPRILEVARAGSQAERERAQDSLQEDLRNGLTLLSGGPVEGVRTAAELATGVDTFTGQPLSYADENWIETMTRLTDTVVPAGSKLNRVAGGYYDAYQNQDGAAFNARLLNDLAGLSVLADIDDPERVESNMRGMSYEMYDALNEARKALEGTGIEVPSMNDLIEAGKVNARNDALDYLMYSAVSGKPLTAEQRSRLERFVPNSVLESMGYTPGAEGAGTDDMTPEERAMRVREMMTAMQALGIQVTEDDLQSLILRESGARVSDVRDLGINPSFQNNPYLDGDTPEESAAARRAESEQKLADLAQQFGLSVEELQESRPLLQPAERIVEQMTEAGATESEIVAELIDKLSRQEQAMIFGEDSLEKEFSYEPLTAEEILDTRQKAAAAEAELRVIMELSFGRQPTQGELNEWLSEIMFTAPEQRNLGYENYTAPSRKNVTSDETYATRLQQKFDATQGVVPGFAPTDGE